LEANVKICLGLVAVLLLAVSGRAQTPEYVRSEAMIPMRDGLKLHAVMLRPSGSDAEGAAPLPFLMTRTPYGVDEVTPKTPMGKPGWRRAATSGCLKTFAAGISRKGNL